MIEYTLLEPSDDVIGRLKALVREAAIELIPLRGAEDRIPSVSKNSAVTITCSPKFGLQRILDHVAAAHLSGHRVPALVRPHGGQQVGAPRVHPPAKRSRRR